MINSCNTLLLIANPQTIPLDIGITIKSIPVRLNVIDFDVVAILTNVSKDFNILDNILYFIFCFVDLWFLFLKYVILALIFLIQSVKLLI